MQMSYNFLVQLILHSLHPWSKVAFSNTPTLSHVHVRALRRITSIVKFYVHCGFLDEYLIQDTWWVSYLHRKSEIKDNVSGS